MKNIRRNLFALLVSLAALPLAAQVNDTYVIPGVGSTAGAYGTRWMSQISIFNPQLDYPLKVSVTFLPTGGGRGSEVLVTVPANGVVFADNLLDELFGIRSGAGALLVATLQQDNPGVPNDVVSRSFLVTTNTFNDSPSGTFGQTVPGTWVGLQNYATDGISAVAHGIRHIAKYGWRTNFGAVNLGSKPVSLRVNVYDARGNRVAKNATYIVPAQGHGQWVLPVEIDHGSVEFFVDDPTRQAVVFPYTSTIDQWSGDPTYQSPTLLASAKTLYPKTAEALASPGRKLTTDDARVIVESATRLGEVTPLSSER